MFKLSKLSCYIRFTIKETLLSRNGQCFGQNLIMDGTLRKVYVFIQKVLFSCLSPLLKMFISPVFYENIKLFTASVQLPRFRISFQRSGLKNNTFITFKL